MKYLFLLVFFFGWIIPQCATAQALRFIDEAGNIHWVERLDEVPPRYRNQVVPPTPVPEMVGGQKYNPQREHQKKVDAALKKKRAEERAREIAEKKLERDRAREAKLREKELEKQRREQKKAEALARKEAEQAKRNDRSKNSDPLPANRRPGPDSAQPFEGKRKADSIFSAPKSKSTPLPKDISSPPAEESAMPSDSSAATN